MNIRAWQRIGILLSILWAVTAGLHTRSEDIKRADSFIEWAYKTCVDSKAIANDSDISSCEHGKITNTKTWMENSWKNVAFAAFVPIPLGWIAGTILVYGWRIQAAGFRETILWQHLSAIRRGYVIICLISLAAGLVLHAVFVMNLYVDSKVPVALPPFMDVVKTGDAMVSIKGTWTRHGKTNESTLGHPLQVSSIECNRIDGRCTEARAFVSGNVLSSELIEYDVKSWTSDSIVFRSITLCIEEIYTIDLNTKSVSGAGRNRNTEYCQSSSADESEWTYRMEKGFPIYWEVRSNARPLPLRVFHALFGN